MKEDGDCLAYQGLPIFLEETSRIMKWMQTLSLEEAKTLRECNDKLARQNFERFQEDLSTDRSYVFLKEEGEIEKR